MGILIVTTQKIIDNVSNLADRLIGLDVAVEKAAEAILCRYGQRSVQSNGAVAGSCFPRLPLPLLWARS